MIQYADIKYNDTTNGFGICVSLWFQGCPHRCKGCHNPETWDFLGGKQISNQELKDLILSALEKNGVHRNLSLLGGEPLQENNIDFIADLTAAAKQQNPNIKIFMWTGYDMPFVKQYFSKAIKNIDYIIDGKFILKERDITLKWRGSPNQSVYKRNGNSWEKIY